MGRHIYHDFKITIYEHAPNNIEDRPDMNLLKKHPALFLGISITALFLCIGVIRMEFLDALELKFYDVRMNLRGTQENPGEIVIVDIDDDSIEKLGRWPWSRSLIARGIRMIDKGNPRVIGLNIILSEPEKNTGLQELTGLKELFKKTLLDQAGQNGTDFLEAISLSEAKLDNDKTLEKSLRESGKIVLPVFFRRTAAATEGANKADTILKSSAIRNIRNSVGGECPLANEITMPLAPFLNNSRGIGHINLDYDPDGTARREGLIYEYQGLYIPSYTLKLAAVYMNVPDKKIIVDLGSEIHLGSRIIPTSFYSELLVNFKGPGGSFKSFSFFDVVNEKVPSSVFKNKLVLVSASASGIMNPLSTPVDPTMPFGEYSANTIWSILNNRFIQDPPWASSAEFLIILVIGLIITFVLPKLKAAIAGLIFVVLLFLLIGGSTYLYVSNGLWIQTTYPLLQLILGYIGIVTIKYFITETGKEKVEGESAETNRMLALSFQSQGMLDMAFDKLRRVPVDDEVKDILYNLALDYERKRQFNKAAAIFEYIEEYDSKFKDVCDRKTKLMKVSETMVFGDGFLGGGTDDDGLLTAMDTKPTLGRYEITKQLGKGAMGIVYLGQDPRINRTTAIKTFKFAKDFEPDEAEKMKEKFFREAESAGTLSHPNIVTIYDAGDEQDLAYIAMEYLEGEDLEKYTKKNHLLPIRKVIEYIADIADALDYAHQKGIVHRDIKPANIMYLKTGIVKITDFGIARITATSQTQTGVVKGTPFYMSPEQFSGERVDGRSDIFSLGTMMFQLLTGKLPFYGESPPALMHQIMNVKHPDPKKINPKIVKPLVTILDKALEKDLDKRYQRAIHVATHLRELGKKIDALAAKKAAESRTK